MRIPVCRTCGEIHEQKPIIVDGLEMCPRCWRIGEGQLLTFIELAEDLQAQQMPEEKEADHA